MSSGLGAPLCFGSYVPGASIVPGYYEDCGTLGHNGDSEFIQMTVGYNYSTKHWELFNGFLSAHTCADGDLCPQQFVGAPSQTFPSSSDMEHPGGRAATYARVHISTGKHANYSTDANCDGGGAVWGYYEDCQSIDVGRFKVWSSHNIGNVRYPLIDCTASQQVGADPDREECFWSGTHFNGWMSQDPDRPPPGYVYFLHSFAYGCKWLAPGTSWCSRYGI